MSQARRAHQFQCSRQHVSRTIHSLERRCYVELGRAAPSPRLREGDTVKFLKVLMILRGEHR